MLVKYKPTGQLGTIDDGEFDESIYEQVGQQSTQQQTVPSVPTQQIPSFLQNVGTDTKNILNGLLNLPKTALDAGVARATRGESMDPISLLTAGGVTVGKGMVNEYNQLLGEPLKGGDVLDRILKRAYEKPVTTTLDVLPGVSLLKKLKGGQVASTASKAPVAENIIQKVGKSMKQKAAPIYTKPSIYGASVESKIRSTLDDLGVTGTAGDQYTKLEPAMKALSSKIDDALTTNPQTATFSNIVDNFKKNIKDLQRTKVMGNSQAITEVKGYLKDLANLKEGDVIPVQKLFALKKIVNKDYASVADKLERGTPLTPREHIISAARQTLDDVISTKNPEVKSLTVQQSRLYEAAPSLSSARKTVPTTRLAGTTIPGGVVSKALDLTGRKIEGLGNVIQGGTQSVKNASGNLSNILSKAGILGPFVSSQSSGEQPLNNILNSADKNVDNRRNQPYGDTSKDQSQPNLKSQEEHINETIPQEASRIEEAIQKITQLEFADMASGGKNVAKLEVLRKALQDQVVKQAGPKITETQKKFSNASIAGQKALDLLNKGNIATGIGQDIVGGLGEKLGYNTQEQQQYRSTLALARTAVRNALLGANMTPKELESIKAFIPEFDDAPTTAKYKLETFIQLMKQFGEGNIAPSTPDMSSLLAQ